MVDRCASLNMSDIVEKLINTSTDVKTRQIGQHPAVGCLVVETLPPGEYILRLLPDGRVTTYLRSMQIVVNGETQSVIASLQPSGCTNRWNIYHMEVTNGKNASVHSVCLGDTPVTDGYVKIKGSHLVHRSTVPLWSGTFK